MATAAQIAANRLNALRSTGPRSAEGKAVSKFNALKTGIQAHSEVIPGEDPEQLDELTAAYHRQFRPATPLERFLVDALVAADWQLRRLHTVEARLWEQGLAPDASNLADAYLANLPAFTRLHRRLEAVERSYYRALHELERLRGPAAESLAPDPWLPVPDSTPDLASFSSPATSSSPSPCTAATPAENRAAPAGSRPDPSHS